MIAYGIDVGLEVSQYVAVKRSQKPRKFDLVSLGEIKHSSPDIREWDWEPLLSSLAEHEGEEIVFMVENARGFLDKKKNPDFVLQDAEMSGRIQGFLSALLPHPVLAAPAHGHSTAWRSTLGITASGGQSWDQSVYLTVTSRLTSPLAVPKSKQVHFFDAGGCAMALLERLQQGKGESIHERFYGLTVLEKLSLEQKKHARSQKKKLSQLLKGVRHMMVIKVSPQMLQGSFTCTVCKKGQVPASTDGYASQCPTCKQTFRAEKSNAGH